MQIDYSRQSALPELVIPRVVTVIGTGAVGCWVCYFSALSGVNRIIIYTIGNVKPSDIVRFPFIPAMIGKPYSAALPESLSAIRPKVEIVARGAFNPGSDQLEGTVFNCAASEDPDFDHRLYIQCMQHRLPYFTGYYCLHSVFVSDHVTDYIPRPSLEGIPAWSGTAALAGLQAFYAAVTPVQSPLLRELSLVTGKSAILADRLGPGNSIGR